MMPLAGLLARSLGETHLKGLGSLGEEHVSAGLQVFSQSVESMVRERLRRLKDQLAKLRAVSGNSKFGGQLEGGSVDDFHRGIADRLGEHMCALLCYIPMSIDHSDRNVLYFDFCRLT